MTDLFMTRQAIISADGLYRYWLVRVWDQGKPRLVVVMLNPSRADDQRDDMTILALIDFAKRWGYGGLIVINLKAYRSSRPADMFAAARAGIDIVGPDNRAHWENAISYAKGRQIPILVAWGNNALASDYMPFRELAASVELICFGTTGKNEPIHPAARGKHRIPRDIVPRVYQAAA